MIVFEEVRCCREICEGSSEQEDSEGMCNRGDRKAQVPGWIISGITSESFLICNAGAIDR